ncbi:helix-hairpin-helix domain-containing protein [Actinomycetospora straminea]|uniref:Helix-hairpin-helix protein n=1 Tax=Actinomycetospora straminea TaxID=663607 RepID=A0ABP9EQY1_9PSEU|nr:helix-hairpin-helix domain-containing protein [Actinomycetospora straminea]MDD7933521.1 helix-hairpin-helix domain-containing protein [Actinomycetospora straminea]
MPPTQERRGNAFTRGGWWFLVHVLSAGLLLPVPLAHAAVRTRRRAHVAAAVAALVLLVATFVVAGVAGRDPEGRLVGVAGGLATAGIWTAFVGGLVALVVIRPQVFGPRVKPTSWDRPPADPAVAAALAARTRRDEARRLAVEDPLLARDLRIGRPDLPRTYDDGGLVDLNTAPGPVIARTCGIAPAHAERIVACRSAAGRFATVDDVFAWADLPYDVWDLVRDRGVVLGR